MARTHDVLYYSILYYRTYMNAEVTLPGRRRRCRTPCDARDPAPQHLHEHVHVYLFIYVDASRIGTEK